MKNACLVYTSLFDLSREKADGRTIAQYLEWLTKTARLFPNLVVFHDGSCDKIEIPEARFIKVDRSKLVTFSLTKSVTELLKTYKPIAQSDITFKIPEYALIQFAKFELGHRLLHQFKSDSILWVDAGISRFIDIREEKFHSNFSNLSERLAKEGYGLAFEIDLKRNISFPTFKVKEAPVGSCRRIISGTSFWIHRKAIDVLWDDVITYLNLIIAKHEWDNEQVYLRDYSSRSKIKSAYFIQSKNKTGTLARIFLGERPIIPLRFSGFISDRLKS
jgi:hypothetical protein